jgi:hypothetical protein
MNMSGWRYHYTNLPVNGPVSNVRVVFTHRLRKATRNLSQNSRQPNRDSNKALLEYRPKCKGKRQLYCMVRTSSSTERRQKLILKGSDDGV